MIQLFTEEGEDREGTAGEVIQLFTEVEIWNTKRISEISRF